MDSVRSQNARIYVAGHSGLAGSALVRQLKQAGYQNIVTRRHSELDLTDGAAVARFFAENRPDVVLLAAARVGGILANNTYPAEFIYQNLAIQTNVIHEAYRCGVKKLVFLGSSCIYPRDCPQPIKEDYFLTGPLEATNRPYAVAKIAGIEMCWAYNRQYGTRYLCVMPNNMYGPGDNYDLNTSHVLPALMRKFHEAKVTGARTVTVWGSGKPRREFVYCDDMASACVHLLELNDQQIAPLISDSRPPLVNIGSGDEMTIAQLAERMREAVGARTEIDYDRSKPDGTPQKLLDTSLILSLGWKAQVSLAEGLRRTYAAFLEQQREARPS